MLIRKEWHYPRYSCIATSFVNGQWRDCASLTSKLTGWSGHSSGGGWVSSSYGVIMVIVVIIGANINKNYYNRNYILVIFYVFII